MFKKFLMAIAIVLFVSCSSVPTVTPNPAFANPDSVYPMRMDENALNYDQARAVVDLMMKDGFSLQGFVDDPIGNYVVWVVKDDVCYAVILDFGNGQIIEINEGCDHALWVWETCVERTGCVPVGENI
jgi:hypothetical protein